MNFEETYDAVRTGVADAMGNQQASGKRMMRITEFEAVDEEAAAVRVIGVVEGDDVDFNFVCLAEIDGEIFPTIRGSVYRRPA